MHDTEAKSEAAIDLEDRVESISEDGNLGALIAIACERALAGDPNQIGHAGARAAIEAYAAWKQVEGRGVPIEVLDVDLGPEPETVPLSPLGKWVGWSSDGLRIVASAETSVEAQRLAVEAGEPQPIPDLHIVRPRR